ncbi:MAG: transposase [Nautiliaceae bacterium]
MQRTAQNLLEKKNNILPFTKYPLELRRHIYTTNIVEGINSTIDKMRVELEGYRSVPKSV